jgi:hypothetical protein
VSDGRQRYYSATLVVRTVGLAVLFDSTFPRTGIERRAKEQLSEVADLIFNSADPNPQEQSVSPIRMKVGRAFGYNCVNCGKQLDSACFSG